MNRFNFIKQCSSYQSGLTCLSMICRYYGRHIDLKATSTKEMSLEESLQQVSNQAEKLGLSSVIGYLPVAKLSKVTLPCILYWDNEYYVVLRKVKRNCYYINDPIKGLIRYSEADIKQHWIDSRQNNDEKGIAIFVKPTEDFYKQSNAINHTSHSSHIMRCVKKIILWIKNNFKFYML
ncbi:MAG: hypothetical protein IKV77_00490 [Alistipes sp.]|nr:hypothetical protein [Alistipes sp.]